MVTWLFWQRRRLFLLKDSAKNTAVLIAAMNEEEGVGLTINEVLDFLSTKHILVVDGHSNDQTIEVAKACGAGTISQVGKGKGDAIAQAVKLMAKNIEFVVLTDADYTYPAEYLPRMIEILEAYPEVGMVCGNRLFGDRDKEALYSRFYFGNKLLALAHGFFNDVELEDPLTGLRVIRAQILRDWKIKSRGFDIEVELNSAVQKQGYETVEIPINYRPRVGKKKLRVEHGLTILKRILSEAIN
jgi:glycosyltransferase involved in cell wall biosynthesis